MKTWQNLKTALYIYNKGVNQVINKCFSKIWNFIVAPRDHHLQKTEISRNKVAKMLKTKPFVATLGLIAIGAAGMFGLVHAQPFWVQTQVGALSTPSFEVASIKRERPGDGPIRIGIQFGPDGLTATGVTTRFLIAFAYNVKEFQVSNGPGWTDSERYSLQAKVDESTIEALNKLPPEQRQEQRRLMVQSLLADRFKLKLNHSTKELPIYALVVAKSGPKFSESDATPSGSAPPNRLMFRPGEVTLNAAPISSLLEFLSREVGRIVVDKTGLQGHYNISLHWMPEMRGPMPGAPPNAGPGPGPNSPPDPSGPSIFTALQEQLGLKLESQKGPVDTLVIDSVEKPSEN